MYMHPIAEARRRDETVAERRHVCDGCSPCTTRTEPLRGADGHFCPGPHAPLWRRDGHRAQRQILRSEWREEWWEVVGVQESTHKKPIICGEVAGRASNS